MTWIILFSIPVAIALFGVMAATAWRRQWRRLLLQTAGGLAYLGIVWIADIMHSRMLDARYFEALFSSSIRLSQPLFRYASPRAFNGDGYTFEVYRLPPELRQRFARFNPAQMADFPRRPDYRSHWQVAAWHPSPAREADRKYVEFALSFGGTPELERFQKDARRVLASPGGYISYLYYDHGVHPGNVDLFIIDLEGERLFLINLNT